MCSFFGDIGQGEVTDSDICLFLKYADTNLGYANIGISLCRIHTHSLQAGGVCALKASGHDDIDINKIGRWSPRSHNF